MIVCFSGIPFVLFASFSIHQPTAYKDITRVFIYSLILTGLSLSFTNGIKIKIKSGKYSYCQYLSRHTVFLKDTASGLILIWLPSINSFIQKLKITRAK